MKKKVHKNKIVAYVLAFFLGGLGVHLFYLKKPFRAILYLLFSWTGYTFILGWLDMFFISSWVNKLNEKRVESSLDVEGVTYEHVLELSESVASNENTEVHTLRKEKGTSAIAIPTHSDEKKSTDKIHVIPNKTDNKKRTDEPGGRIFQKIPFSTEPVKRLTIFVNKDLEQEQQRSNKQIPTESVLKEKEQLANSEMEKQQQNNLKEFLSVVSTVKNEHLRRLQAALLELIRFKQELEIKEKIDHSHQQEEVIKTPQKENQELQRQIELDILVDKEEKSAPVAKSQLKDVKNTFIKGIKNFLSGTFYDEETIILPEFAHVKTPSFVKEMIHNIKGKEQRKTLKNSYIYISVHTRESDFLNDSLRYSQKTGDPKAKFVPFMQYYPTFRSLDDNQKNWYFYWREEVLKGRYIDTDLSYIYLFAYELINYTFNQKTSFNVSMLVRLYNNYKERFPSLSRYLPEWIGHMLLEAGEKELASNWIRERTSNRYYEEFKKTLIETEDWSKISISIWKKYLRNHRETAFFTQNKNRIYNIFKSGIQLLREYYEEQGISIVDEWLVENIKQQPMFLFQGAVVHREERNTEITMNVLVPSEKLFDQVTALFKYSENIMRLLKENKRMVKVDEEVLPEEFRENMKQIFLNKDGIGSRFKVVQKGIMNSGSKIPDPPKDISQKQDIVSSEEQIQDLEAVIEFDDDKIKQLEEENRLLLQHFEQYEDGDEHSISTTVENNVSVVLADENVNDNIPNSEKSDKEHESDVFFGSSDSFSLDFLSSSDGEASEFIHSLSELEKFLLKHFTGDSIQVSEAKQLMKSKGVMINVVIDNINEKSMDILGDKFIELEGEQYVIYEEYIEVLNELKESV
ncbi:TerB N-terminal domain-containing protein [Aeribacillus sp. FSL K6-1305]|uniref:TerB N-terminal domain-containing protein n=1 Tax=Aeribacillus sp. FSL K6-1305 TaxID=2954569 RepID=UPI0030FDCA59